MYIKAVAPRVFQTQTHPTVMPVEKVFAIGDPLLCREI